MPSHVALLRAVNVSRRWLKMEAVRSALSEAGFTGVETHIQSGNVRVRSRMRSPERVAERISRVLGETAGFEVPVMVRTPERLARLVAELDGLAPLVDEVQRRYVAFAPSEVGTEAARRLAEWQGPGERAVVVEGDHVVVDMADSFQAAKLNPAAVERIVGQRMTARNDTVVRALTERWMQ